MLMVSLNIEAGTLWLKYRVDGFERHWKVEVSDDWADSLTVSYVMDDIQRGDHRFFCKDNGQAMILFYLDAVSAAESNKLSDGARNR